MSFFPRKNNSFNTRDMNTRKYFQDYDTSYHSKLELQHSLIRNFQKRKRS